MKIERNKVYDVKLTGEQLAFMYLWSGHSNGGFHTVDRIYNSLCIHTNFNDTATNLFPIDLHSKSVEITSWMEETFKEDTAPPPKYIDFTVSGG